MLNKLDRINPINEKLNTSPPTLIELCKIDPTKTTPTHYIIKLSFYFNFKSYYIVHIYLLSLQTVDPAFQLMRFPLDDELDFYFEK